MVLSLARKCGWKVVHFHDSRRSIGRGRMVGDSDAKGWPDLVLMHPGRGVILFRELKSEKGRPTPEQRDIIDSLRACGMDACVWRPTDENQIIETLTGRKPT